MQLDADSLAAWLITLGYPDHEAARTAAQRLNAPQLHQLWQLLQTRLISPADSDKLNRALKQSSTSLDPKVQELQLKHKRLEQHISECKQQTLREQVQAGSFMECSCPNIHALQI